MLQQYIHTEIIHNFTAAKEIIPIVLELLEVSSVVDIGCGLGTWAKTAEEKGVKDFLGVDGVDLEQGDLKIPKQNFLSHDLTLPLKLDKKYDLAICLEVVEHLPESAANTIISSLAQASDHILFSAAIPGQGGQNHLNEQWPSYWIKKFKQHGYKFYDCIRPIIWNNERIEYWYRQNIFLVSKKSLPGLTGMTSGQFSDIVHPQTFSKLEEEYKRVSSIDPMSRVAFRKFIPYYFKQKLKKLFRS